MSSKFDFRLTHHSTFHVKILSSQDIYRLKNWNVDFFAIVKARCRHGQHFRSRSLQVFYQRFSGRQSVKKQYSRSSKYLVLIISVVYFHFKQYVTKQVNLLLLTLTLKLKLVSNCQF